MPDIKLTDRFGVSVDAKPAPRSALLKYFQQIPSLQLDSLDLRNVGGLTLEEPAIHALRTGVTFQQPVNLGEGTPALSVGAGAHAFFRIITDPDDLPGPSGDTEIPPGACYVAFGIDATVSADLSAPAAGLRFGAAPSTRVGFTSYTRFPNTAGLTLLDGLRATVADYSIPGNTDDLAGLPEGQIASVDVTGTLELSGTAELLATANPLASASLPAPFPAATVSAGGSATVGVSCEIQTEYRIVAHKLAGGAVHLGWYRRHTNEVAVKAKVSEGVSAGFGEMDLFPQIVRAISADAEADLQELQAGGLSDHQAAAIHQAVKAAVSRRLEIAVATEFSASDSRSAAFLYEIHPDSLTDESRRAVDTALRGNFTALHDRVLPGVSRVRSVWDHVRSRSVELNVNLLGILNHRSIARLALDGKVLYEPATGSLVIADEAAAERIQSTQVNFGADARKLRHVLAESFFITAAYRGTTQAVGGPGLTCSHTFFELRDSTAAGIIARDLRTGVALGLLSGAEAGLPAGTQDFGRTLFTASSDYDNELVVRMFLDSNDAALPRELYETVGRNAIQFLVQEDDEDAARRMPAIDNSLWSRMKQVGQPSFGPLFPGVPEPVLGAIRADYSTIQWWADAMIGTARQLAAIRSWLSRHPAAPPDDMEFQSLRRDLASQLRRVADTTREEFGEPWGLIAMNQLVGRRSGARMLLTGPKLVRERRRALSAVTGP